MIANGDRDKAKEYQSLYVHTFGNLTITGYNSTLSNKAFNEKKERKDNNGHYIGYRNGLTSTVIGLFSAMISTTSPFSAILTGYFSSEKIYPAGASISVITYLP